MDRRDLERLGHHVVSRRVALGYRNRTDLADSLQFTVRTLADIEHGVRKASPGTYAMLENKLAWAPGSIDTILAGGEPTRNRGRTAPHHPRPARPTPPPTPSPAPPPRSCCWSYDAASSPPATDATKPGTTGTAASTRTATGPNRASSQHLTDPLPDPDAVCRRSRPVVTWGVRPNLLSHRCSRNLCPIGFWGCSTYSPSAVCDCRKAGA